MLAQPALQFLKLAPGCFVVCKMQQAVFIPGGQKVSLR
jgi:hypothetical protein